MKTITSILTAAIVVLSVAGSHANDWLYDEVDAHHPWRKLNNHEIQKRGIRPEFHFNSIHGNTYFYCDPQGYLVRVAGRSIRYVDYDALLKTVARWEDSTVQTKKGHWDYQNWNFSQRWFFSNGNKENVVFWIK
ncbi:MAG: hypothetical protein P1V20_31105 [Verrucomicrobiales bacterium]|nr:hypothetical protein [Verrucomicrobiales bacterium]